MTQTLPATRYPIDAKQVKSFLMAFFQTHQVIEVRALKAHLSTDRDPYDKARTISGYFDDFNMLATSICQITSAQGIYVTINRCPDLLLAKANNRLKDRDLTTTTDEQISARQGLLLDLDPERAGGISGIPADDHEHEIALKQAQHIRDELLKEGWPAPIEIDSGNGAYLFYAIDLPAEDEGLVQRVLAGLAARFDIPEIHIDQTTFNQARIMRLPGTWNCKADGTKDRPHRQARLLAVPESINQVTIEQLQAVAIHESIQPQAESSAKSFSPSPNWDEKEKKLRAYLDKKEMGYKVDVKKFKDHLVNMFILENGCVFNEEHKSPEAAVFVHPISGHLCYKCFHNSCGEKSWKKFLLQIDPNTEEDEQEEKEPSTYAKLMEICDQAHYIHTLDGDLYARVPVKGHYEVVPVNERGSGFKRWLTYEFRKRHGIPPNSDAIALAISGVQSVAEYDGEEAEVHTRMATKNDRIYLDLANKNWECIEISSTGWKVIACPPVYFRRPNGMLPLPYPQQEAGHKLLDHMRELFNTKEEKDLVLMTAWLVGALHPTGPYALLDLNGPQGSRKSTATRFLRNMIDPNRAPTRNTPDDEREAAIAAKNNMVIAHDNLSSIPLWFSDTLCKLATGGGLGKRALYTDDEEKIFNFKRPIIINGIEDGLITQSDLLNRSILVTLEPPDKYIPEEKINERFEEMHPRILGSLLNVVSVALRDRRRITILEPPRLADLAYWITAAEPALKWEPGTFLKSYAENQDSASSIITESSPVAKAIIQFLGNHPHGWEGLTSSLHDLLIQYEIYKNAKTAPKASNKLSGALKRIAPAMKKQGILIQQPPRQKDGSHVILAYISRGNKQTMM